MHPARVQAVIASEASKKFLESGFFTDKRADRLEFGIDSRLFQACVSVQYIFEI